MYVKRLGRYIVFLFNILLDKINELKINKANLASKEGKIKDSDSEAAQKAAQVRAELQSLKVFILIDNIYFLVKKRRITKSIKWFKKSTE